MLLSEADFLQVQQIVREAGKAIMDIYQLADRGISYKTDESPVTKADLASNAIIESGLNKLESIYPIVSEETMSFTAEERVAFETSWLIDPLDGTKEFIAKNDEFAVCVALIHKKRAVAGFVYVPAQEELFYAQKGAGAYRAFQGNTTQLICKAINIHSSECRVGISRSHVDPVTMNYINTLPNTTCIGIGSVLKLTKIAEGKLDLYPRLDNKTSEWDIAAGQIILEEAGGSVIDQHTQEPLLYNKPLIKNPSFIASTIIL